MRQQAPPTTQTGVKALYENVAAHLKYADRYIGDIPLCAHLADMCNVRPIYLPVAAVALLMLLLGTLEDLILGVVGFFYPAWSSFKAIEGNNLDQAKQWLAYWVVYAFFSFIEIFSDTVLFWVPFYYIVKLIFLVWLFLPQYKGATIIYNRLLKPFLTHHTCTIESFFGRGSKPAQNLQECDEVTDQTVRRRRL